MSNWRDSREVREWQRVRHVVPVTQRRMDICGVAALQARRQTPGVVGEVRSEGRTYADIAP